VEQKRCTSWPDQKRSGGAEPYEHISPFRWTDNPTRSIYEQRQEMIHLPDVDTEHTSIKKDTADLKYLKVTPQKIAY